MLVSESRRVREKHLFDQWGAGQRDREWGSVRVCVGGRQFWSRVGGEITNEDSKGGKQSELDDLNGQ